MSQSLYIRINYLVVALKELVYCSVKKQTNRTSVKIQSDMNNTERIVKVLWDPEEEVTSDLRL